MIRLFVSEPIRKQHPFDLSEKQNHYLLHVMRCKNNDFITCFNGQDGEWLCHLNVIKKKCELIPFKQTRSQTKSAFCALCPALIKKDCFDLVLQKATELNVTDIYPLKTERSVVSSLNVERAKSLLAEAAEQSERLDVPTLHDVSDLKTFLKNIDSDITLCYLSERGENTGDLKAVKTAAFVVGPEGGFSSKELALLQKHPKTISIHFPDTILRAETASIAALSGWQLGKFLPHKK